MLARVPWRTFCYAGCEPDCADLRMTLEKVASPSPRSGHAETALSFAANACTIVVGLATQAAMARLLAPPGRGSYAVCMVLVGVLSTVFSMGTDRATQFFVSSRHLSAATGLGIALFFAGVGSVL